MADETPGAPAAPAVPPVNGNGNGYANGNGKKASALIKGLAGTLIAYVIGEVVLLGLMLFGHAPSDNAWNAVKSFFDGATQLQTIIASGLLGALNASRGNGH